MLTGRTAVVTGGSRGIGRGIATALVRAGAKTWLLARGADVLEAVARELGPLAVPVTCDVSDREAIARAAADIADRSGGAPDILVNNAGRFPLASLDTMDAGEFANTVAVNVLAPFLFVRAFLPAMRARGHGHIVTIGSVADRAVYADNGAYASTKHGQRAMHEVLREETRGSGVRASLVSPGPSDTSIWDAIDPDNREGFTPRAAMLNANAVADAVLWVVTQPATVNIDELRLSRA